MGTSIPNSRVSMLLKQIEKATAELEQIRAKCPHKKYFVGLWSWRIGAVHPSRICSSCMIAIPGITDDEAKTVS